MRKLTKLEPAEVSLVKKGANRKKFIITKSEGEMTREQIMAIIKKGDPKVLAHVEKILKAHDDAQTAEGKPTMGEKAKIALKAILRIHTPFKDEITPDVLNQAMSNNTVANDAGEPLEGSAGTPAEGGEVDKDKDGKPVPAAGDKPAADGAAKPDAGKPDAGAEMKPEHFEEAKKAADEAYKAHLTKMGYKKYPDAEMKLKASDDKNQTQDDPEDDEDKEGDEVSKSTVLKADGTLDLSAVPAEQRAHFEMIFKGHNEVVRKNAELESQLKQEREERREKEIVAKAAGYTHLGINQADLVAALKDADKAGKEAFERIAKQYETMNEQIKKSALFGEIGSSQSSAGKAAWEKIEAAAQARVAKSGTPMTKEQGIAQVLETEEGQRFYAEYVNEQRGA